MSKPTFIFLLKTLAPSHPQTNYTEGTKVKRRTITTEEAER